MSVLKNFRDVVRKRATMAHQGKVYAYISPQERTRQRPVFETNAVVMVNDMVEFATMGKSLSVARVGKRSMARSAMVGEMVDTVALSPLTSIAQDLHIHSNKKIPPTDVSECCARNGE